MNKQDREFKSLAIRTGACLLLFLALYVVLTFFYTGAIVISFSIESPVLSDIVSELILGVGYFLTFTIPAIVFRLFSPKECFARTNTKKKAPLPFIIIFATATGGIAFSYLNNIILNLIGVSNSLATTETEPLMIHRILLLVFTTAIVPAICEEFLFRQTILKSLLPYGKAFAIISSSIFFGLMHQNVTQILYTTAAGLILGYAFVKTESFLCVFLIHFINNLTSVIQQVIVSNVKEPLAAPLAISLYAIILTLGIISLIFLIKYKKKQKDIYARGSFGVIDESSFNYKEKRLSSEPSKMLFSSPTVLIFTIICIITLVIQILH